MNSKLKTIASAAGVAALALSVLSSTVPASAQSRATHQQGSVYGPLYNPSYNAPSTFENGAGVVREPRLYQLIRQKGAIEDRTFEIEFLDPGVQAFVFTFG